MFSSFVWFLLSLVCCSHVFAVHPSKKSKSSSASFRASIPPDDDYSVKSLSDWEGLPIASLRLISNAHNLPSNLSAHRLAVNLFHFYNPPVVTTSAVDPALQFMMLPSDAVSVTSFSSSAIPSR